MSVSSTSSTSSSTTTSSSTGSSSSLSDTGFLQILITQLQNQDPLDPTDANQMVTELCSLTQVQTLNNIQSSLSNLSGMGQWASTIGDYMQVSGSSVSNGDKIVLAPGTAYDSIALTLKDSSGNLKTVSLSSGDSLDYSVTGSYTIQSATYSSGGASSNCNYAVYRGIAGVQTGTSGTLLVAGDGTTYATSAITAITTANALSNN